MKKVSIVGGGIAGLTLAAALDPARFAVTLIEAEPEREAVGAGIGLWPSARRALARIGVTGLPEADGRTVGALHTLTGRRLVPLRGPDLQIIRRPQLMAALAAAVPESVERRTLAVTDPAVLDGALVIGADGVRSRVRGLVHPPAAERVETPWVTLRGILPTVDPAAVGEYWGRGRLFGLAPLVGGGGYWFTAHRSTLGPEPLSPSAVLAEASERYADASPGIRRILASPGADTLATRLWTVRTMPRYIRGRYAVLGDAAHASLPNLGRGGCDAILDAVSLATTLNSGRSLATWQARRLPVTQAARLGAAGLMNVATLAAVSRR
ncbi:NAD(P)-binding protein [Calidifontibacter sp. DB0510]|uniref:NAD(P)-binding protein n=1 Tax=Metallococcus carri TaxID=1656884 RepID=A0A967B4G9_9MICO|nr:FAD-dependent monooxygenase [Metallococcus carri]NHN57115.1 NAD(P)-binding protein [Metallococcus carri]NOP39016.1 NAD(P)-binding protein [Calidifontibacter sp. DB2511S]